METTPQSNGHAPQSAPSEMSASIAKLAAALAKAQARIEAADKSSVNPHFRSKYADISAVREACRLPLAENGLSIVQLLAADGKRVTVTTMLMHESGEWLRSSLTLTARSDSPQDLGSATTYGRRYGMAAMVGVVADEDDDGNAASGRDERRPAQRRERNESPTTAPASPPPAAAPSSGAAPETDEQRIERWTKAFNEAKSLDEVKAIGMSIAKERHSDAVRLALSAVYGDRCEAFGAPRPKKKAKAAVGPCSICGDKEHGSQSCPNSTAEERAEALRKEATEAA